MALALSILALVATFWQLFLQRNHNEKSVKPLIQVNVHDSNRNMYVHVQNNGLGPFILETLTFIKDGVKYSLIKDCLSNDPKSYFHVAISGNITKIISPGNFHEVFSITFGENDRDDALDDMRHQLSAITLIAEGRDIYDNKIVAERKLDWFTRHQKTTL